jgi:AFG3 family protein
MAFKAILMLFKQYYFSIGDINVFERNLEEAQRQLGLDVFDYIPVSYESDSGPVIWDAITSVAPFAVMIVGGSIILRKLSQTAAKGGNRVNLNCW